MFLVFVEVLSPWCPWVVLARTRAETRESTLWTEVKVGNQGVLNYKCESYVKKVKNVDYK